MRSVVVSLIVAMLVAACISSPEFYPMDEPADAGGGSSPIAVDPDGASVTPSDDDAAAVDAALVGDDASDLADTATPPPPPPPDMCPPTGSPAGTLCCGAGNTPPLCVGLACAHCADCVAKGCAAGMICCAISPGKSGKYQSMACALPNYAGFCP